LWIRKAEPAQSVGKRGPQAGLLDRAEGGPKADVEHIGMMTVMVDPAQFRESAKWAAASFVPAMLPGLLLAGIAGGLHGGGKPIFLIFVAPMFLLGNHIEHLPVVAMWAAIIGFQILYWFIIVLYSVPWGFIKSWARGSPDYGSGFDGKSRWASRVPLSRHCSPAAMGPTR
jgi:hypothetical protein